MKRIGILTFHRTLNYGAILQAFALKTFMQKHDCIVHIVDYCCEGNNRNYIENILASKNIVKKIIKSALYYVITIPDYRVKIQKFEIFRKKYLNVLDVQDCYDMDMVICGSDQIWNPSITGGFKSMYFGAKELRPKYSISYGASLGSIDELGDVNDFFSRLKYFNRIGVREKSLYELINSKQIKNTNTIDPTFLLSKNDYIDIFKLSDNGRRYILVYELVENDSLERLAIEISRKYGLSIVTICGYYNDRFFKNNKMFDAGPVDFLNYIYNAEYVITNSFHGVAFSIIFEKQFLVIPPLKRASRINDLLKELGLENRSYLQESVKDEAFDNQIDYLEVNRKLQILIRHSKLFLENTLSEI